MRELCSFLLLVSIIEQIVGTKYFLAVPKVPSYDSQFTAVVTAFEHNSETKEEVLLEYRGAKNNKVLNSTRLYFEKDGSNTWTVVFPSERMQDLGESSVKLHMTSKNQRNEIFLTFRQSSGYIFIQTDKPVYTPGQTVKFRVIAVDEDQRLSRHHLKVDIINDQKVAVDRMRYSAEDAFKGQNFELPKDIASGFWYISANFEGLDSNYRLAHNVTFEVKEYVLPRFSASLHINANVITRDLESFQLTVISKYIYGRPVHGKVEIQLGIWRAGGLSLIPGAVFKGNLHEGRFDVAVPVSTLSLEDLTYTMNQRLYVNVNVIELGTLENFTIIDTSTFITHPYYVVDLTSSKEYFKPGFPYIIKATIKSKALNTESKLSLEIQAQFFDSQGRALSSVIDTVKNIHNPVVTYQLNTLDTADQIKIRVHVSDDKHPNFEYFNLTVLKFYSVNKEYLQIVISTKSQVSRSKDGTVFLSYTKPTELDLSKPEKNLIFVTVLTKGQMIFSTNVSKTEMGISYVNLPKRLYRELSPAYRIVAYYFVYRTSSELVADSLLVDVEDICLEDVFVLRQGLTQSPVPRKPKDVFGLLISGTPYMRVGLVAVDKAIFLLNDKQTLTRELLFQALGSHDPGTNEGDGRNTDSILKNSGLEHMMIDTDAYTTSSTTGRVLNSLDLISSDFSSGGTSDRMSEGKSTKPEIPDNSEMSPPSNVRNYFPESWLFEEKNLSSNGNMRLNVMLPDSITTWSFLAVGLSANRGICVSLPLEQDVRKPVFIVVRMPYKASRLEEINIKIAIHNYHTDNITAQVVLYGDSGICFAENSAKGAKQSSLSFQLAVEKDRVAERTVKIIPLKIGELALKVEMNSHLENDAVERKLRVVAEGLRERKSITFVLDPGGKHATYTNQSNNKIHLSNTAMITNEFVLSKKLQHTTIDLALPKEIIKGTESCRISAFGDLMGDIITHAVVQSKGLMEEPTLIAQEVLNDMGPIVHALNYINATSLMTDDLRERSDRFIIHSVTRLLKYKTGNAFSVRSETERKQPAATWLTALILKSLCHAMSLAFIDKPNLIDAGFSWLQAQIKKDGSLNELDWTGRKNNAQSRIDLAAEVLISVIECNRSEKEDHVTLQDKMALYLHKNLNKIKQPVVLSKATYALLLYNPDSPWSLDAVKKLKNKSMKNEQGHIYWGDKPKAHEPVKSHWHKDRVPEASIEATAYGLMVFLRKKNFLNVDAVADWLVAQRKHNGAFNGAKDSTAAIQALTEYSLRKHQEDDIKVDMNLIVSTGTAEQDMYRFKFTQMNATQPESRNNVRLGKKLEVLTEGQGLGQMQINVEYNVPIDKNQECAFNISVEVKTAKIALDQNNPLCSSCDFNCPGSKRDFTIEKTLQDMTSSNTVSRTLAILSNPPPKKKPQASSKPKDKKPKPKPKPIQAGKLQADKKRKTKRSASYHGVHSNKTYCITVCVRHLQGVSGPMDVKIEMLTGFRPVANDVHRISETVPNVVNARLIENQESTQSLLVQFSKIEAAKYSCFSFRTTVEDDVERLNGAKLEMFGEDKSKPACVLEYHPPVDKESLKVFCADFNHINRGECKCFSGLCSRCGPVDSDEYDLDKTKRLACKADIVYQLQLGSLEDKIHWLEINATVHSVNKTKGSHELKEGDEIVMMSPSSCWCFKSHFGKEEIFYLLTSDVDRLMDRNGTIIHRYVLDENTTLLRVSKPLTSPGNSMAQQKTDEIFISQPLNSIGQREKFAVAHDHLALGLMKDNRCEL